jgi:hypothetical protein
LLYAYRVGFSATLNELMVIGGVLALVGAVFSYGLVRQRDFVASGIAATHEARQLRGVNPQPAAGEVTTQVALSSGGSGNRD